MFKFSNDKKKIVRKADSPEHKPIKQKYSCMMFTI